MEIKKSETIKAEVSKDTRTSVYVCRWNDSVQFEIGDYDSNGVWHELELTMPLAVARSISKELVEDIATYDVKKVEEAAEDAAEKAAEEAERIALEADRLDLLGDEETNS